MLQNYSNWPNANQLRALPIASNIAQGIMEMLMVATLNLLHLFLKRK